MAVPTLAEQTQLSNGVRYCVMHRPGADVTSVSVWILAGSRHEPAPGAAHLLEHVVMQCVPPGRSMRVVDEIESWGGDANAMTTRDHVVLHASVPTTDAGAALGVLAAAAATMAFDDQLVDAERRVVQEELRLAAADPSDIVHDVFFEAAYGSHPMGRPVGGTIEGVSRLGAPDLTAWSRRYVTPVTTCVVVCGGMTADEVHSVLAASALPALEDHGIEREADSAPAVTSARRDLPVAADTAAVALGGQGFALSDPAILAADIVMELLAGANSSVLTEEIRSRQGLSYDIWGGASGYRDTGSWRIAISTAPEHRDEVVDLATGLLTDAVRRGWSPAQVRTAARRVAGLARVEAESSLEESLRYGDHVFVGDCPGWSLAAQVADLAAIDAAVVNRTAQIMTDQLVVATAGGD